MDAPSAPNILPYGKHARGRAWLRWLAVCAAIVIAAAITWWQYGTPIRMWWVRVKVQRLVLLHLPGKAAVLSSSATDDVQTYPRTLPSVHPQNIWDVACILRIVPSTPVDSGHGAVVFCHERTSPGGHRRLVVIRGAPTWTPQFLIWSTDVRLFEIGSILLPKWTEITVAGSSDYRPAGIISGGFSGICVDLGRIKWGIASTLYEGSIDPGDTSRFTIPYQIGERSGAIIGRLNDDDSVSLRLQDGSPLPAHPREGPEPGPATRSAE